MNNRNKREQQEKEQFIETRNKNALDLFKRERLITHRSPQFKTDITY